MNVNSARSLVVEELADALRSVVEAMISVRPEISWQSLDGTALGVTRGEESVWWAQTFSGLPSPSLWVGATVEAVNAFGQSVLSALGVEDASPEDARSSCQDIVAQAANALAESLSELITKQVTCSGVTIADAPSGLLAATLAVTLPSSPEASVLTVRFDWDFLGRLAEELDPLPTSGVSPAERIADLELCVHATLGRTSIPLQNVFKLTVGSVIDIGKTITDPVDVVINDRVIARGQLVVCNGSYAVKLTHQLTRSGGQ